MTNDDRSSAGQRRSNSAVWLKGPDGIERWYMEVPGDPKEGGRGPVPRRIATSAREYLEKRLGPVSPAMLAQLTGVSRFKIYNDIHNGLFPSDGVTRVGRVFRISNAAALWYVDSLTFDPQE